MNIGFYATIAVGGVIGGFLAVLYMAAWWEAKRDRYLYGTRDSTIVVLGNRRHEAAAAIKRSAERG